MSRQLVISAAFSTFAMAAFALFAAPLAGSSDFEGKAGSTSVLEAPALAGLPVIGD